MSCFPWGVSVAVWEADRGKTEWYPVVLSRSEDRTQGG